MSESNGWIKNTINDGVYNAPVLQGQSFNVTFQSGSAAPIALAQLPSRIANFTGRNEEVNILVEFLNPATTSEHVVISAVAGMAGIGKTALAITAGHAASDKGWYAGGVLYVDLHGYDDQRVDSGQALDALLRALGVPGEHIPPGIEEKSALYRSMLAQNQKSFLIIADNVSSEAQVRPLLPGAGPHRVVVTSRDTLAGLPARLLEVTVLTDVESVQLLETALNSARPDDDRVRADHETAFRLVRMCDGLPLALQIVAALLRADPSFGVSELADELAEERDRLERLKYDDGDENRELSVEAAFELSYRHLQPAAAQLFRMLVINPGPNVSTKSAVILADSGFSKVRRTLSSLAKAHMIELAPGTTDRWRMHDLVRIYARRLSDLYADNDRRDQARQRIFDYYVKMTRAAVTHLVAFAGPSQFSGRDAAIEWLGDERSSLVASAPLAERLGLHRSAFDLAQVLVEYLSWRRYVEDWVTTATVGLAAARSLSNRHNEADAMNNLGLALHAVRRFDEAINFHEKSASIFRKIGDEPLEGAALHNIGMIMHDLRRWDEAIAAYEKDLAICQKFRDLPGEALTLNNLAICLQEAGHLEKGIRASKRSAEIFKVLRNPQSEGMALVNVANGLRTLGQPDAAVDAARNGATLLREAGDRYREASALVTLSGALNDTGRHGEAITASQEAAAIFSKVEDLHGEGLALSNLGSALTKVQRFDEAFAAFRKSIDNLRKTGDRHMEGMTLRNFGITLYHAQHLDEAIDAHRMASEILSETGDVSKQGIAVSELGVALGTAGRFSEAVAASREAAALLRGTGQREEATALYNLALSLSEGKHLGEALDVLQNAIVIFHKIGDKNGKATALGFLTNLLAETGEHHQAIVAGQSAVAAFREADDKKGLCMALNNLGLALRDAGENEQAIAAHQETAAIYKETGDWHGEGLALNNLGLALQETGLLDQAIAAHREAVAIYKKCGERSNEGKAAYYLALALRKSGQITEADTMHREAMLIYREIEEQANLK